MPLARALFCRQERGSQGLVFILGQEGLSQAGHACRVASLASSAPDGGACGSLCRQAGEESGGHHARSGGEPQ